MIKLGGDEGEAEKEIEMCWEELSTREKDRLEFLLQRHHREFSKLENEGEYPEGKRPIEKVSRMDFGSERKRMSGE